jgi:hypothetical protein
MRIYFTPEFLLSTSPVHCLPPTVSRLLPVLLLLLTFAGNLTAGTYYLSPTGSDMAGTGARQKPWKSIQHATSKMPDDGSTVVLLDGLYEGSQSVVRQFTKFCTVRAENRYRAQLCGGPRQNRVLSCYSAANVIFQGLEIFGTGATQGEYLVHITTPKTHNLVFEDCILHDCYNNDLVKINDDTHHILFRNCVVYNQTDHGGDQHFDINTCTDIRLEDSIFFNDYAGSGRRSEHRSQGFIVAKNSGSTPDVTRRITLRGNVFLNYDGKPDMAFILLGEDGKPFIEAQQVLIENNLFIHNSPVQTWGTLLYKGGLKDITFRANTVVGHAAVKWTGAESAVCLRIEKNPPMGDLTFVNNIFCDPTGQMPRFSISGEETFAPGSKQVLLNNLYWNAGKPIPTETKDVLAPDRDAKKILADPRLGNGNGGGAVGSVTLPRWDSKKGVFLSGQKTIRQEFERLVKLYAVPAPGSPAVHAADSVNMPKDDILGNPRGDKPDIGCFQRQAEK